MILSSFKAALENGLRKAHRSVGEPFGIFEEKPKRTCKRPPYKQWWKEQKVLTNAFKQQAIEQSQRANALEETLHALQRELAQKEAQNAKA
jgi:hypothetical protein